MRLYDSVDNETEYGPESEVRWLAEAYRDLYTAHTELVDDYEAMCDDMGDVEMGREIGRAHAEVLAQEIQQEALAELMRLEDDLGM